MLNYILFLALFFYVSQQCVGGETSLFPIPSGPLYGISLRGRGAWTMLAPFTRAGNCQANASYTIRKMSDFFDYTNELECIFAGGSLPERMPTGPLHCTGITVLNLDTRVYNNLVERFLWKGKYIEERECNGKKMFVGLNAWAQPLGATLYFVPKMSPHNLTLAVGEHKDEYPGIVVEYHNDVLQLCPELKNDIMKTQGEGGVAAANAWSKNIPFMDFIRFVGRQEDGGDLYILKTFLRDWFRKDREATTVGFTAVVNYDKKANPNAYPGISTKPLEKGFSFLFPGLLDMIQRGLPFDNLLTSPSQTLQQLQIEGQATRRNVFELLRTLPSSYSRIWNYNKNWLRSYDEDKLQG